MAPRLILSNAQKSAGSHASLSAGGVLGSLNKVGVAAKGGDAANAVFHEALNGSYHSRHEYLFAYRYF
jgi:hypothetical protein